MVMHVLASMILCWVPFAPESTLDVDDCEFIAGRCLSNRICRSYKNFKGVLFK